MKGLLAAVLLLAVANAYQWNSNSGHGYGSWGRGPPFQVPPGFGNNRFSTFQNAPWYPRNQRQGNRFHEASVVEAEWVCRNPKTGDMMIIASDNGNGNNGNGHQWQQSGAQERPDYPFGNGGWPTQPNNPGPSEPDDDDTFDDDTHDDPTVTIPPPTSGSPTKKAVDKNDPKYTGEGKIDIRLGTV